MRFADMDRLLHNKKATRVTTGVNEPSKREGSNGDITIRNLKGKGVFLFVKYNNNWYARALFDGPAEIAVTNPGRDMQLVGWNPDQKAYTIVDTSEVLEMNFGSPGKLTVGSKKSKGGTGFTSTKGTIQLGDDTANEGAIHLGKGDGNVGIITVGYHDANDVGGSLRIFAGSKTNATYKQMMLIGSDAVTPSFILEHGATSSPYGGVIKIMQVPNATSVSTTTKMGSLYVEKQSGDDDGILKFKNHDGDITTLSSSSASTGYLPLAGGALTGDITITDTTAPQLKLLYNGTNYAQFEIASTGSLEIETVGSGTTDSDITLNADGDIILEAAGGDLTIDSDVKITATKKLYLDGGGDTHIKENSADSLVFTVGNDVLFGLVEDGTNGNYANFKASCAGFTRQEAVFSVTGVIGSAGTDDTDIDFRHSNKYRLEMTGDITNINLVFPIVSGNFLLVCTTDGDHDVTNWKVYVHDGGTPATTADVMWAGGSVPAFTNNGIDIVSFYWDKNEEQAYGTASLAFATP